MRLQLHVHCPSRNRVVITLDRYARVNIPNVWPADHRNPVAYMSFADLKINPDTLEWTEFSDATAPATSGATQAPTTAVIEEARMMIARVLDPAIISEDFDRCVRE